MIPRTDLGTCLGRSADHVEHFVPVGVVVDRATLFVEVPLLVLVSMLVAVDHQFVVTFDNDNSSFYTRSDQIN